jgi:hypothetical protein
MIERAGKFFEASSQARMSGEQTFNMLYDMIPDRIEEHIFIPFLQKLFDDCDKKDGYLTFLELMYPHIGYTKGVANDYLTNTPKSFLFSFILGLINLNIEDILMWDELPDYEDFITIQYGYVWDGESEDTNLLTELPRYYEDDTDEVERFYEGFPWVDTMPKVVGVSYEFDVSELHDIRLCKQFMPVLGADNFIFKAQYNATKEFLDSLKSKHESKEDFFAGLF